MEPLDEEIGSWLEREAAGCQFQDVRHGKRFLTLLGQLSGQIGGSIPNWDPLFGGSTPLSYMIHTGLIGMYEVRRLLDARAAGN